MLRHGKERRYESIRFSKGGRIVYFFAKHRMTVGFLCLPGKEWNGWFIGYVIDMVIWTSQLERLPEARSALRLSNRHIHPNAGPLVSRPCLFSTLDERRRWYAG